MKFYLLTFIAVVIIVFTAAAQKEKAEYFIGVGLQPPLEGGTLVSVGFTFKSQFNLKNDDAITAAISFSKIGTRTNYVIPYPSNFALLPLLVGYQKRLKKFFIEPQAGAGIFSKTIVYDAAGHEKVLNNGAIFWGLATGYRIKRFIFFLDYHRVSSFNTSGLYSQHKTFGYGGINVLIKID